MGRRTSVAVDIIGHHRLGHHLPCGSASLMDISFDGGDRWVAHTGIAGHRRGDRPRRSYGIRRPDRRRAIVATLTRRWTGRDAGFSDRRSAISNSHRASSCCRRIHSASTIAAASSTRLVAPWVSVAISLTPFTECCAPRPRRSGDRRQALIAVFSSLLATLIRRGLALSATGMVNRNTPLL